ncbi:hypothetical protein CRYUN_Cryun03dG0060600 [Craigia yunnanensis]
MAMAISSCGVSLQWTNSSSYSSVVINNYEALIGGAYSNPNGRKKKIRSNPKNARNTRVQVDDEDTAVVNLIRSVDWVVLLDERGLDIGSEQMAELLGDAGNKGASRLSFCIGGPYGHGQQIRERANISIKLSSMVLNHQIALVVLVEQLYR